MRKFYACDIYQFGKTGNEIDILFFGKEWNRYWHSSLHELTKLHTQTMTALSANAIPLEKHFYLFFSHFEEFEYNK
jgi:hypothetical protein